MQFPLIIVLILSKITDQAQVVTENIARRCVPNGTTSGIWDYKWMGDAVRAHNRYRDKHAIPPLNMNMDLCKSAQWRANKIAEIQKPLTVSGIKNGSSIMLCGESLVHYVHPTTPNETRLKPGRETVREWYNQVKQYDFQSHKGKTGYSVDHFTQLIWRDTAEMCMTYARAPNGGIYVVAHYYPKGNNGRNEFNVFETAIGITGTEANSATVVLLLGLCWNSRWYMI